MKTYTTYETNRMKERIKKLILDKMQVSKYPNECMLTSKYGEEYFIHRSYDGYNLYFGCDLIVGDTTLDRVADYLVILGRG